EVVYPALARWVDTVRELLPRARPSAQAGLAYLPDGKQCYARAIRIYTTLPLSPEELHQTGLDHVAALEAQAVELGAGLGLRGLDEVFAAVADSAGQIPPEQAMGGRQTRCSGPRRGRGKSSPRPFPPRHTGRPCRPP